jgi:hypothetical protein
VVPSHPGRTRRRVLAGAAAGAAALAWSPIALAEVKPAPLAPPQPAPHAPAPPPPISKLTLAEQLLYATVRLQFVDGSNLRWGTAFFFKMFSQGNMGVPVLVTNKHVFGDSTACLLHLHVAGPDGLPVLGSAIPVEINDLQQSVIHHPDADLAILPVGSILNQLAASGKNPFSVSLTPDLIPTPEVLAKLDAIEDVLTVGYPGQLWDQKNDLPIFHRGVTASPPNVDFNGDPQFLVDFATIGGASGSPMLIFNDGIYEDPRAHSINTGDRVLLIGVVFAVALEQANGQVIVESAPLGSANSTTPYESVTAVPSNLGVCLKASKILDFEPVLVAKGVTLPAGYVMRAAAKT